MADLAVLLHARVYLIVADHVRVARRAAPTGTGNDVVGGRGVRVSVDRRVVDHQRYSETTCPCSLIVKVLILFNVLRCPKDVVPVGLKSLTGIMGVGPQVPALRANKDIMVRRLETSLGYHVCPLIWNL